MRRFISALLVLLLVSWTPFFVAPEPAWCQTKKTPKNKSVKKRKPRVVYEKETVMRFEGTSVEGRVIKPDGFFLLRKRPKRWQDLIKVRKDYETELLNMKFEL